MQFQQVMLLVTYFFFLKQIIINLVVVVLVELLHLGAPFGWLAVSKLLVRRCYVASLGRVCVFCCISK